MSNISIQKVDTQDEKTKQPVFAEIAKRFEDVRRRAQELFHRRTNGENLELDDWLAAEREIFGWAEAGLEEKASAFEIRATLAGFDAKEVEVTTTPDEIAIHAVTRVDHTSSREVFRHFGLPRQIQLDKVSAKLEKGILHITAPYAGEAKPAASTQAQTVRVVAA